MAPAVVSGDDGAPDAPPLGLNLKNTQVSATITPLTPVEQHQHQHQHQQQAPSTPTTPRSKHTPSKSQSSTESKKRLSIRRNSILRMSRSRQTSPSRRSSAASSAANSRSSSPARPHTKRKDQYKQDFKDLEQELTRFLSKTGVHKSNVLRLALLPFLRQQRAEDSHHQSEDSTFRIKVLQKWWLSILEALRDRSHPVAGSDRNGYLEAISGIMARKEWTETSATTQYIYESLLYDTVKLVISKLCLKTVPLSLSAFSGKVLAFAYFWAPGVAPVLLHLLQPPSTEVDRVVQVSYDNEQELRNCMDKVRQSFPPHLTRLLGTKGVGMRKKVGNGFRMLRPKAPEQLGDLYGPWARRWNTPNSEVFAAFMKHYYTIISEMLPPDLPSNGHLASPGLIMIQAFVLQGLDAVVHPPHRQSQPNEYNASAVSPLPGINGKRRVDQMKVLGTIREILHNDDACVQYYESYCRQFERILHAVVLRTRMYDVESCILLADLVEEYLSSLILAHSLSKHRVQIEKDNAVDWEFWITVVAKMLTSDNAHTELRALALLFNVWDNIPIGGTSGANKRPRQGNGETLEYYLSTCQDGGLRWACTCWLLSDSMWKRYFCHWQPLVRSYYQRLICWRVASVGDESDLLSSILYSNYNSDARALLKERLYESHAKITTMLQTNKPAPSLTAASPVVSRKLAIVSNPASSSAAAAPSRVGSSAALTPLSSATSSPSASATSTLGSNSPQRVNAYDVFDDIAYSYPTSMPPSELFPTADPAEKRHDSDGAETVTATTPEQQPKEMGALESIGWSIKKKWNKLTGGSSSSSSSSSSSLSSSPQIRHSQSSPTLPSGNIPQQQQRAASPSFSSVSSSTPPSFSHTPVSGTSSTSTPPSPRSVKSLSSTTTTATTTTTTTSGGKKKSKKIPPRTSLTMHLIPPPPQLLRAKPEITRPATKFGLEYCDRAAQRHRRLMNGHPSVDRDDSAEPHAAATVSKPRLPFEMSKARRHGETDLLGEDSGSGSGSDSDNEDADEDRLYDQVVARVTPHMRDDIKYWKYSGRALAEWSDAVLEFEEFVRTRKMMYGAARLEDIHAPFMVAEVPAKLKAG